MKKAIVIATSDGREDWVRDCLASIRVPIPVLVVSTTGYELGKIQWILENTDIERFIFLQDSVVIKNNELLMSLFNYEGSVCIMDDPDCFGSFMGLYERSTLNTVEIPKVDSREESIKQEWLWTKTYVKSCANHIHPISVRHKVLDTVYKNGRENRLYVNDIYEKWKGTWMK